MTETKSCRGCKHLVRLGGGRACCSWVDGEWRTKVDPYTGWSRLYFHHSDGRTESVVWRPSLEDARREVTGHCGPEANHYAPSLWARLFA